MERAVENTGELVRAKFEESRVEAEARVRAWHEANIKLSEDSTIMKVVQSGIEVFKTIPGIEIVQDQTYKKIWNQYNMLSSDNMRGPENIWSKWFNILIKEGDTTKVKAEIILYPDTQGERGLIQYVGLVPGNGIPMQRGFSRLNHVTGYTAGDYLVFEEKPTDMQIAEGDLILDTMGKWFAQYSPAFNAGFEPAMKLIRQGYDDFRKKPTSDVNAGIASLVAQETHQGAKPAFQTRPS